MQMASRLTKHVCDRVPAVDEAAGGHRRQEKAGRDRSDRHLLEAGQERVHGEDGPRACRRAAAAAGELDDDQMAAL